MGGWGGVGGVVSKWAYTRNRKSTSKQAIAVYENK